MTCFLFTPYRFTQGSNTVNRSGVSHPERSVTPSHDHGGDDNDEMMARRLQEAEDEREAREIARRLEEAEGESQMRVSQAMRP